MIFLRLSGVFRRRLLCRWFVGEEFALVLRLRAWTGWRWLAQVCESWDALGSFGLRPGNSNAGGGELQGIEDSKDEDCETVATG